MHLDFPIVCVNLFCKEQWGVCFVILKLLKLHKKTIAQTLSQTQCWAVGMRHIFVEASVRQRFRSDFWARQKTVTGSVFMRRFRFIFGTVWEWRRPKPSPNSIEVYWLCFWVIWMKKYPLMMISFVKNVFMTIQYTLYSPSQTIIIPAVLFSCNPLAVKKLPN